MRINSATGFVLKSHLHLVSISHGDDVAGKQLPIVGDDNGKLIAIFDMHRQSVKVTAVLLKHKILSPFPGNGIHRQNYLLFPLFNGNSQLKSLPRTISPVNKANVTIARTFMSHLVG
jgi:hypothetical protein